MTEWEKGQRGYLYDPNNNKEIVEARSKTAQLCFEFNMTNPGDIQKQKEIIEKLFKEIKGNGSFTVYT